jgi:hypothetical protein
MSDKSNKKPVWVDEVAHGILKDYSAAVRRQMVEVATQLILDHVTSGSTVFSGPAPAVPASVAAPVAAAEVAAPSEPVVAAAPPEKKKSARAERKQEEGGNLRHLGGVWLV